jgi:hypothetical protein
MKEIFNEAKYLAANPDVATAVKEGIFHTEEVVFFSIFMVLLVLFVNY